MAAESAKAATAAETVIAPRIERKDGGRSTARGQTDREAARMTPAPARNLRGDRPRSLRARAAVAGTNRAALLRRMRHGEDAPHTVAASHNTTEKASATAARPRKGDRDASALCAPARSDFGTHTRLLRFSAP